MLMYDCLERSCTANLKVEAATIYQASTTQIIDGTSTIREFLPFAEYEIYIVSYCKSDTQYKSRGLSPEGRTSRLLHTLQRRDRPLLL